jgi:hypothetical protein
MQRANDRLGLKLIERESASSASQSISVRLVPDLLSRTVAMGVAHGSPSYRSVWAVRSREERGTHHPKETQYPLSPDGLTSVYSLVRAVDGRVPQFNEDCSPDGWRFSTAAAGGRAASVGMPLCGVDASRCANRLVGAIKRHLSCMAIAVVSQLGSRVRVSDTIPLPGNQ